MRRGRVRQGRHVYPHDNKLDSDEAFEAALKQEGIDDDRPARLAGKADAGDPHPAAPEVMGKINITEEEARKSTREHVSSSRGPARSRFAKSGVRVERRTRASTSASTTRRRPRPRPRASASPTRNRSNWWRGRCRPRRRAPTAGLVGPLRSRPELTPAFRNCSGAQARRRRRCDQDTGGLSDWSSWKSRTADAVLSPEEARDRIADVIFEQKRRVELKKVSRKAAARRRSSSGRTTSSRRRGEAKSARPCPRPNRPRPRPAPEKPTTN